MERSKQRMAVALGGLVLAAALIVLFVNWAQTAIANSGLRITIGAVLIVLLLVGIVYLFGWVNKGKRSSG
ncbi:hypothetical protein ACIQM4_08935 [Streptomyces sp. NPDC091272]|uniref:hypothetical protein n=1 Tax=Streptomyces sp. NPDC091272 TaxID=3365981 RepID=UPI003824EADC